MTSLQQRIAALQQRSTTPNPPLPAPNPTPIQTSLRDKIARFEKKGGLPVPARRAGELYANRLPHKSDELHVKESNKLHVKNDQLESRSSRTKSSLENGTQLPNEQSLIPLPQSETNEQSLIPLPQLEQTPKANEQIPILLPQSETNEQTFIPLPQSEQTLTPLPQLETNKQTLAPLPQLEADQQTPTPKANEQIPIPLPQLEQTLTPKAHEHIPIPLPHSETNEQTLIPLSQSESAKELQSVPILVVNDQDQTPSSPTTPHAPTFNLSSTLKESPLAVTSPERTYRPLSMPPIQFTASSNPSPSLAKMSTPIQDISYDHAQATDDQPTVSPLVKDEPEIQIQPLGNGPGSVTSSNFRATIHHKVSEPPRRPTESSLLLPQSKTPVRRVASAIPLSTGTSLDLEFPPSPVFGDLTDLLQSTVLLQERLEKNVIPASSSETTIANSGVPVIVTDDGAELPSHETNLEVRRLSKEEVEENKRTLWKLQAKREEQARSKVRNGFFGPFGRASKDVSREAPKGMSIDGAVAPSQQQQLYSKRSKSPSVLNTPKDLEFSSDAPGADNFHSKTLESQSTGSRSGKPSSLSPKSPPKSPKSGLSAFRLLASRSSPSSAQDHRHGHGRNSVSTSSEFSSEDSAPSVVTPPDGVNEFGGLRSWLNMGSPQSKKGGDGLGNVEERDRHVSRAVTFAGKIWQRARTRSGASTRSVQSLRGRWSHDPPPTLPPLPDSLMASDSQAGEDTLGPLPPRKTPLLRRSPSPSHAPRNFDMSPLSFDLDPSRSPTHKGLQAYRSHSPSAHSILSESPSSLSVAYRSRSDLGSTPSSSPGGQHSAKRRSWTSSSHHANSSVLDIDLFDAFPSVPENHPLVFLPPSPSPLLSQPPPPQQHTSSAMRSNSAISLTPSVVSGSSHVVMGELRDECGVEW